MSQDMSQEIGEIARKVYGGDNQGPTTARKQQQPVPKEPVTYNPTVANVQLAQKIVLGVRQKNRKS